MSVEYVKNFAFLRKVLIEFVGVSSTGRNCVFSMCKACVYSLFSNSILRISVKDIQPGLPRKRTLFDKPWFRLHTRAS